MTWVTALIPMTLALPALLARLAGGIPESWPGTGGPCPAGGCSRGRRRDRCRVRGLAAGGSACDPGRAAGDVATASAQAGS